MRIKLFFSSKSAVILENLALGAYGNCRHTIFLFVHILTWDEKD